MHNDRGGDQYRRRAALRASPGIKRRQAAIADSFEHRIIIRGAAEWAVASLALLSFAVVGVSDASWALTSYDGESAADRIGLAVRALSCAVPLLVTLLCASLPTCARARAQEWRCRDAPRAVGRALLATPFVCGWFAVGCALWATKLFVIGPIVSAWLRALSGLRPCGVALVPGAARFDRDVRAGQEERADGVLNCGDHLFVAMDEMMRRSALHRKIESRRRSIAGAWALELPRLSLAFDTALLSRMTVCDFFARSLPLFALQCAAWARGGAGPAAAAWSALDWLLAAGTVVSLAFEVSTAFWLLRSRNFASYIPFESMKPKFEAMFRCAQRARVAVTPAAGGAAARFGFGAASAARRKSRARGGGARSAEAAPAAAAAQRSTAQKAAPPLRAPRSKVKARAAGGANALRRRAAPPARLAPTPGVWPPALRGRGDDSRRAAFGSPTLLRLTPGGPGPRTGKRGGRSKRVRELQARLGLAGAARSPLAPKSPNVTAGVALCGLSGRKRRKVAGRDGGSGVRDNLARLTSSSSCLRA